MQVRHGMIPIETVQKLLPSSELLEQKTHDNNSFRKIIWLILKLLKLLDILLGGGNDTGGFQE